MRFALISQYVVTALTIGAGGLLAYRWSSPIGSLSLGRVLLLGLALALLPSIARLRWSKDVLALLAAALSVVASLVVGLLHTDFVRLGVTQVVNTVEAFLLLGVVAMVAQRTATHSKAWVGYLPYLGFLPSLAIALVQAVQLVTGRTPTIPLLGLFSLDENTENAARVAFGSGLNNLGIDRVAAATGDPPTFGIMCALLVVYHAWVRRFHYDWAPGLAGHGIALLGLFGLLLSASTTAIVVLALGLVATYATGPRPEASMTTRGRWSSASLLAILTVIVLVTPGRLFLLAAWERVQALATGQGSGGEHLSLMMGAWDVFSEHPIHGVGTGEGSAAFYGTDVGFSSFHSLFSVTAAEQGGVGLLCLGALLALLVLRFWPAALSVVVIASWAMYLDINRLPYLWALMGVVMVIHRRSSELGIRQPSAPLEIDFSTPANR